MSLGRGLRKLYPEADPYYDFRVENHGSGASITYFDEGKLGARPSDAVILQTAQDAVVEESEKKTERTSMRNGIAALKAGTATSGQVQKALAYLLERL